ELSDLPGVGDAGTVHQGGDAGHVGRCKGGPLLVRIAQAAADDVGAQDAARLAAAGVAAGGHQFQLGSVVGVPGHPLAAVHRAHGDDVRMAGGHGDPAAVVAGAGHQHDAPAGRVLDLLVDEGVVIRRIPGQAHVDDVGAVIHGPA